MVAQKTDSELGLNPHVLLLNMHKKKPRHLPIYANIIVRFGHNKTMLE